MKRLNSSRADTQIWWHNYAHAMNISDEVVTWSEGIAGAHADVWWVSTSMYKLRPLATIWAGNALLVPADLTRDAQELVRYHLELGVNNLTHDGVVPVYGSKWVDYSENIRASAHSLGHSLGMRGIDNLTTFIESTTMQRARNMMNFGSWIAQQRVEIVNLVNSKTFFLDSMARIWVPTAYGVNVYSREEVITTFMDMKRNRRARRIYLKLSRAASGQWVFPVDITSNDDDLRAVNEFINLPQTQHQMKTSWVRVDLGLESIINSPNVMIHVWTNPDEDRFVSASMQLLGKRHPDDDVPTVHKGNISWIEPGLLDKLIQESKKVANWMRWLGAYWIVWLDYVVDKDGKIFIMEANYRVNGWLAAAMKGHDLGAPYWAANGGVLVPEWTSLNQYVQHLQRSGIEYDGNSWVILLNHATSPAWKMQIAVLWQTQHQVTGIMEQVDMK